MQKPLPRMSWTWTGYDYDPVFRYKEEPAFFQTGRNNAEARWGRGGGRGRVELEVRVEGAEWRVKD